MKMRKIDLSEEQRGSLCCVCEEFPAAAYDVDCGPVCGGCLGEALRAERALRSLGCVADEGMQIFARARREIKSEGGGLKHES